MRQLNVCIAVLAAAAVFSLLAAGCGSTQGSSSKRTIYSFVSALKHHNFGRACSYMSDDIRGADATCPIAFTLNAGMGIMLGGVDTFAGIVVKPGSEACPDDHTCTYVITDPSGVIGDVKMTVVKQGSGRWRIAKIG